MHEIDPYIYPQWIDTKTVTFKRGMIAKVSRWLYQYVKIPALFNRGYLVHVETHDAKTPIGKIISKSEDGTVTVRIGGMRND